ncbi:pseudaminic acid cytidylyltransferase [Escherichia coli]|uniref:WcnR n=1 Tax=Escherichia coli TaxID=562 RepID=E2DNQ0_ECOLX|nr:pseudaminic acid cytidylyltransferase [Escherichia coli]ADN43878.1 WcnR [Escherichia coli]EES4628702.1 pseudaminic acid cytidylyltransferase [Escherichia coli]EES4951243.1 pseudaminic acid cytidylyltransferase [Escherichia coli]EEX8178721.1 pseudaminic acid cytidylyltransferase [Escherichia coli]EFH3099031.1 pseudaminic acid cytidylyltransferase [Escherichia coli]
MNVAIIPARGGSKRIPRKNIKMFCGKPMIAWSIDAAKKSGVFDRIIVSTDDEEIAAVARKFGAEVPFMRPDALSNDFMGTIPVIRHAAEWLASNGNVANFICCIYATAPFICPKDIIIGLDILRKEQADYAFTVTRFPYPIQRSLKINKEKKISMFFPDMYHVRSQDLEESWHDAGQFYWGTSSAWLNETPIFSANSCSIELPRERVQDIDTPEDWIMAEWLYKTMEFKNESVSAG